MIDVDRRAAASALNASINEIGFQLQRALSENSLELAVIHESRNPQLFAVRSLAIRAALLTARQKIDAALMGLDVLDWGAGR